MAEALEYITECPVCMLQYKNPKILPCLHSLCEKCTAGMRRGSTIKCPMCSENHDVKNVKDDFRLTQIIDALQEKEDASEKSQRRDGCPHCELCEDNAVDFYCEDCQQWMCASCKRTHLKTKACRNHTVTSVQTKNKELKDIFQTRSTEVKQKLSDQFYTIEKIESEISKLEQAQSSALEVSNNLRKNSVKDVNNYYDSIDSRIIEFIQNKVKYLEEHKRKLEKATNTMKKKWEKLEKMVKKSAAHLAVEGISVLDDTLVLSQEIRKEELYIKEVDIKVMKGRFWDASTAAVIELNERNGKTFGSGKNVLGFTQNLETGFFKRKSEVQLKNTPNAIRKINQNLWSCCQNSGYVEVFDLRLERQRTLSNTDWGYVYDVTDINGQLVLATYDGLYHINQRGEIIEKIDDLEFTSVVTHDNNLYANASCPPRLMVYACLGSTWNKLHTLPLPFHHDAFVTVAVEDYIITACSGLDNNVITMSLSGEVLHTIIERDAEAITKLRNPRLCQQQPNGSILIADCNNHRLLVVDKNMKGSDINLDVKCNYPGSALYIDNKLYVTSRDTQKLSLYECSDVMK